MQSEYIIEMVGITKVFPGIVANDNINLRLKKGEIHALLGENGAGKSTLMSVLFGMYQPEKGVIKKNGEPVKIYGPNDATALGIGMVHQHFKLVDVFTVLDNIILGSESTKFGFIQRKNVEKRVRELSEKYSLKIDLHKRIEEISVGMQQRAEILKMLYRDNEILIFDEPTAVLTPQETQELMNIMRTFAGEGKSILFITHKLSEIMAVADRVSVIRKGKYIGTVETEKTTKQELSQMMVGRPVELSVKKKKAEPRQTVLKVEGLSVGGKNGERATVNNVSFEVKGGETVAIAGVDGNGQSELIRAITGLEKMTSGKVFLCGEDITDYSVRQKLQSGLSHIPEDRHKHGLVLDFSLENNCVLQRYFEDEFQQKGFIKGNAVRRYSQRLIDEFDVRSNQGPVTLTRSMSGGNQQKAVIARELDRNQPLIIAVQPTRGLDVGAIENIHRELIRKRDEGKAILLVSFELDEVMNVADRILVMYEGEIRGEFYPDKTTVSELGLYMAGTKRKEEGDEDEEEQ